MRLADNANARPVAASVQRVARGGRRARGSSGYVYLLPSLVIVLGVTLVPALIVVWVSLHRTQFFELQDFVGIDNYRALLVEPLFHRQLQNSFVFTFGTLLLAVPIGFALAVLLETLPRLRNVVRAVLLIPWTLSIPTVAILWIWLLNPSYGPINYVLTLLGAGQPLLLGSPFLAMPLLILVATWWTAPYAMVLLNAALQGVPRELYDAVLVDGGGTMARVRHVTLPFLLPTLISVAVVLGILCFNVVTIVLVLTGGGPIGRTETVTLSIFRAGVVQGTDVARSGAASVVVLITTLTLTAAGQTLARRTRGAV